MPDDRDDQLRRLEEAFREVSARRAAEEVRSEALAGDPVAAADPPPDPVHDQTQTPPADQPSPPSTGVLVDLEDLREQIRQMVREEVEAALADSDLSVEVGVLVSAVEHLKQRVDALTGQVDQSQPGDAPPSQATTRGTLLHGLRSMSPGRVGRGR